MTKPKSLPRRLWSALLRRKITAVVAVWGVLLGVLAFSAPSVTVAEQSPVSDAIPMMSDAASRAVTILSAEQQAFTVGVLHRDPTCAITLIRHGERLHRSVTIHLAKTEVSSTAIRLGEELSKRYPLMRTGNDENPRYTAVVNGFVSLSLTTDDTTVTWTMDTGCRPPSDSAGLLTPTFNEPAEPATAMQALGVEKPAWSIGEVECVGDGVASTAWATGRLPEGSENTLSLLTERLPSDAAVRLSTDTHLSYVWRGRSVTISIVDRLVTASATQACPA